MYSRISQSECIFTIKQIQKTKINTITRARSHKNMTLTTHTCKGIQTQRQILGKNFTSWVNSRQRAQEDKDKQMHTYTDTQTHIQGIQLNIFFK